MTELKLKGSYPASPSGNFWVKDSIGVPHPYMITVRHVVHTSNFHMGYLINQR